MGRGAGHLCFTVCTSVIANTVAAIVIPHVCAVPSIQARFGGTEAHVITTGEPRPPWGTVAGEGLDTSNLNIRTNPTIQAWRRTAILCRMSEQLSCSLLDWSVHTYSQC